MNHPSASTLAAFRIGRLSPDEVLEIDDHLASCDVCRNALAVRGRVAVRGALEALRGEHVAADALDRFVEGTSDPAEHEAIAAHAALCPTCAEELADLEAFRRNAPPPHIWRWTSLLAAAAAVTFIIAIALLQRRDVAPVHHQPAVTTAAAPAPPATATSDPLATLSPSLRSVAAALDQGTLASAPLLASLGRPAERQRAHDAGEADSVRVEEPVGVVTESDTPRFAWRSSTGEVRVQVFDRAYSLVVESPRLKGTSWRPASALRRGTTYRWQLIVYDRNGDAITTPAPPNPPALFHIISGPAEAELAAARASGSSLEEGLICIREGLVAEGADALSRYAETHPDMKRLASRAKELAQSPPIATNGAQ